MNIEIIQQEALDATAKVFAKHLTRSRTELTDFDQLMAGHLLDGYKPPKGKGWLQSRAGADQVLRIFCAMVQSGITPPPVVMRFIADGVHEYLKDGKPWQVKDKRKKPAHLMALARLADEAHPGNRAAIAAHLGIKDIGTLNGYLSKDSDLASMKASKLLVELRRVVPASILSDLVHTLNYITTAKEIPV